MRGIGRRCRLFDDCRGHGPNGYREFRPYRCGMSLDQRRTRIGTASPTPQTLIVDRGDEDIIVSCTKDGYITTKATLPSELEGMTFGNLIFGGLVGVVVDAASDANTQYPESIMVTLVPDNFSSETERDLFFDKMVSDALGKLKDAQQELTYRCESANRPQELCEADQEELQEAFDFKIEDIERMRNEANLSASDEAES